MQNKSNVGTSNRFDINLIILHWFNGLLRLVEVLIISLKYWVQLAISHHWFRQWLSLLHMSFKITDLISQLHLPRANTLIWYLHPGALIGLMFLLIQVNLNKSHLTFMTFKWCRLEWNLAWWLEGAGISAATIYKCLGLVLTLDIICNDPNYKQAALITML